MGLQCGQHTVSTDRFMKALPVIVGFGGVNAAGRTSFNHSYCRTVFESLPAKLQKSTIGSLSSLMGLAALKSDGNFYDHKQQAISADNFKALEAYILKNTLIRKMEQKHFDINKIARTIKVNEPGNSFFVNKRDMPKPFPKHWTIKKTLAEGSLIESSETYPFSTQFEYSLGVQSAGQLPTGFDPAETYKSHFHPKGLQLAIVSASDAVKSVGIEWNEIKQKLAPDEIAVYSASAMAQLDTNGNGGMLQARLKGKRVSAKQLPLGLNTMPADFVNAYVLGNVGITGANAGACATFLYNLRLAIQDIQNGKRRLVIVGNAEAPLEPDVIEGYIAMSALATDENLKKIDGSSLVNHTTASRPFGENCGFTLGESGQYFVLMEDSLALELGAQIHGAVLPVFVSADGYKKSISAPGPGNYITLAKAVAAAQSIFGKDMVCNNSFLQAHGSSTPQNRVSESKIFSEVASAFGIKDWPITAIKAFLGHSLAPASADQLNSSLGIFKHKILPGIKTVDKIADDVVTHNLSIKLNDFELSENVQLGFLNSKGFGGNNATGTVIGPNLVDKMLRKRYSKEVLNIYYKKLEKTRSSAEHYDAECTANGFKPIYNFGKNIIDDSEISITEKEIKLPGFDKEISLSFKNFYKDMF